jgi:anti-anti-sigma factor
VAPDAVTVTVAGEIDASNAANLGGYVQRHSTVASQLCVDLRDVTFFATSGLAILRRLEHQFQVNDASWGLLTSPAVQKVLRICGADDLPRLDSTANALNQPVPAALAVTAR